MNLTCLPKGRRVARRPLAIAAASAAVLASFGGVGAATFTYTVPTPEAANTTGAPDNWSAGTAAGWDVTPVSASDTTLVFNGPTTPVSRFTANDVANPFQLNVLTLQGSGTAAGASALTLQGNGLNFVSNGATTPVVNLAASKGTATTYTVTVNNAVTLTNNTTFQGAGNAAFSFAGAIGGAGTLTKSGASVLTLAGTTANTYAGTTTVSAGELDLNKTAGVNAVPGDVTVTGGTVRLVAANQIPDAANVSLSGSSVLDMNAKAETINNLSVTGTSVVNNTGAIININGTLTNSSTSTGGSGAAFVVNSGGKVTVGGLATFNTGSQTLIGGGTNTSLTFNGGLNLTGASIRLNSGATSKIVLGGNVTVNDPGTTAFSSIANNGSGTLANGFDLNGANRTFTIANGSAATDFVVAAVVTSGTGTGALTKAGAGLMALTNPGNNYTGGTSITGGTLAPQADGALGTGGVTVSPGAVLDLSTGVTTGAIADTATLTLSSSGSTFSVVSFGASTLNESVGQLLVNGVPQSSGTYTSANLPNFITGSGSITVVPEPASLGQLGLGAAALLRRRRRAASAGTLMMRPRRASLPARGTPAGPARRD